MLSYYYDIKERDNFSTLFKDTWIAEHATAECGRYQVLSLDFSGIGDTSEELKKTFNDYCCIRINAFMSKYKDAYPKEGYKEIVECRTFSAKLNALHSYANNLNIPLCLIVDEYDNFTNTILANQGHDVYHQITHANGFYRDVFKIFKSMFTRVIMTGVSPVTLDDLTSGYNIATNVTLMESFNQVLGFSSEEVRKMIRYYKEKGLIPDEEEKMMAEMKEWYNGYCFSRRSARKDSRMFNSSMVLKYLQSYVDEGHAPDSLLDDNTRTDYAKMKHLIQLDQLNGNRKSVILQIAQNGYTFGDIVTSFPAANLTNPDLFTSLLYYYGMLTMKETEEMGPILSIPNNNVRIQYYNYLVEEFNKIVHLNAQDMLAAYRGAAIEGKWKEKVRFLCDAYHRNASIRSLIEGERNVQGFLLGYLSLNPFYLTAPEVEVNYGYCDFFLMPNLNKCAATKHSYIIELKYLAVSDSTEKAEAEWQDATRQLQQYVQAPKVQLLCAGTQLHAIIVQVKGSELLRCEEV
jgi:hypothetical protein